MLTFCSFFVEKKKILAEIKRMERIEVEAVSDTNIKLLAIFRKTRFRDSISDIKGE